MRGSGACDISRPHLKSSLWPCFLSCGRPLIVLGGYGLGKGVMRGWEWAGGLAAVLPCSVDGDACSYKCRAGAGILVVVSVVAGTAVSPRKEETEEWGSWLSVVGALMVFSCLYGCAPRTPSTDGVGLSGHWASARAS